MSKLSLALPQGADPTSRWRSTIRAHEQFVSAPGQDVLDVRPMVLESWRRSAAMRVDPDRRASPLTLDDADLESARRSHPLSRAMPVVRKLLVDGASDAGVIVVVGDAQGRLLWTEGDDQLRRRAERMHLVAGATWREDDIGTNAIGTALAVGDTVQVFGSEHYARTVQPWSCTAAPIRDPWSRDVIGVLDITGGADVVSPQSAFLVRSAVAAIEAELRFAPRLDMTDDDNGSGRLAVLGRDRGALTLQGRPVQVSLRHTELLLLLAANPEGLSAADLAWKMYEHDAAEVTVRAEVSRLRKAIPGLVSPSARYQLCTEIHTDAAEVADCLSAGDYARAVELYRGELLPRSTAPGVVTMRYRLHGWLRNALLSHGDTEALHRYVRSPAGAEDVQAWRSYLDRLPSDSSARAEVSAVLAELEADLGDGR
ncbi:GAF domain-containing protein [Haloactinopolyspora alba]|uniref:GAF domain-containing protein n=1 Tax=Haloactinopolyspora alba TaxID=648780 RepID=A0A2P8DX94_9ACTN|nr:GAF domain-containing protein [Haloactinopolyspora alba]PSL01833.1 GAF domain-containing protein [Haloactinopolyspora alba]